MHLELRHFVATDVEPGRWFIDVQEICQHEHHEIGVFKRGQFLCAKLRHPSKVQYRELKLPQHQLLAIGGPRSHPIAVGVIGSKICIISRLLEVFFFC